MYDPRLIQIIEECVEQHYSSTAKTTLIGVRVQEEMARAHKAELYSILMEQDLLSSSGESLVVLGGEGFHTLEETFGLDATQFIGLIAVLQFLNNPAHDEFALAEEPSEYEVVAVRTPSFTRISDLGEIRFPNDISNN